MVTEHYIGLLVGICPLLDDWCWIVDNNAREKWIKIIIKVMLNTLKESALMAEPKAKLAVKLETRKQLLSADTSRWANIDLLLGQRRRRWANSKPTLGQRLMFAGLLPCTPDRWRWTNAGWFNIGPPSTTLAQHQIIMDQCLMCARFKINPDTARNPAIHTCGGPCWQEVGRGQINYLCITVSSSYIPII